ncbi:MAG: hypothetical protein R3336_08740 [Phycisphaeraceae bacterium]|nr:hypothetical protein [Phycisphaeraceae bacterium]
MGKEPEHVESDLEEVPLCLHCLQPVHPIDKICPHCGQAVGQLTPYLPWESIRWEANIWGKMWQQAHDPEQSWASRLFRLLVIVLMVPVLLVGLIPMAWHRHQRGKRNKADKR